MSTMKEINEQYVNAVKYADMLTQYEKRIQAEINSGMQQDISRTAKAVYLLSELIKEANGYESLLLKDACSIGTQYVRCNEAIDVYRTALAQMDQKDSSTVFSALDGVKQTQARYDGLKEDFFQKHNVNVNSIAAINQVVCTSLKEALSEMQVRIAQLKNEAREVAAAEYTTELKKTDPLGLNSRVPTELLVARTPVHDAALPVMCDIGISYIYKNIFSDLRNQGNIMVLSDFEHIEDHRIDEFIIAYVLRFIENFPLGSLNVHIFDQNTNYLYKRLNNSFQGESASEVTKRIVQIHTSLNDLSVFRDVNCEDIFKKTSVSSPDLYAVYEFDHSDPFNLIILRDGLIDGSGYVSSEILDTINSLTRPNEIGHRCGLRFLIVDNSISFEKNLTASNRYFLNAIHQNCDIKFQFDDEAGFAFNGKPVEVLHITGDLDTFVQERSLLIANALNSKERSYINIDEVSADEIEKQLGNIMYIPVGKSGGNVVELPLSCKDEDGTVAGQCIGYIAIGQSGSGKSSFFHSLVLNGCIKYSPKELQFWLLDFKNGGASSKYSDCGIPHIRIIAENNKIDDALCLFQMVLEEMERRSKAFNRCFTDNIIEYNKKASEEGLEYFPRIIIAIDEVQEIFREDNASVLQKLISSISTRMRSAGMHFVMVAQNLSEGKSYMLKDAFMPSATGRICFRVAQDIPRDSGFGDDFIQRKGEIAELKTGEAYVSYGSNTIKKVKMAFVSPQEMSEKIFAEIRAEYADYSDLKPRVIGSKTRLSVLACRQDAYETYRDVLAGMNSQNGVFDAVLGEDVYRMSPFHIHFSPYENSSALILGSDKQMASSICTSIAVSLMKQDVELHLFNGDRAKISEEYGPMPHPFMYICQNVAGAHSKVQSHRLNQLNDVLKDMYSEYLRRRSLVQKAEDDDPTFSATVLIINDLFGIESFISNEIVEGNIAGAAEKVSRPGGFNLRYDIFADQTPESTQKDGPFREGIQNILSILLKNGYRYNLHVVLAIKGDPTIWRAGRTITGVNNTILFNDTEYADQMENSYYLKEMLKNISNDGEETVAVWASRKAFSKIRPVIYMMSNQQEKDALDLLVKGE